VIDRESGGAHRCFDQAERETRMRFCRARLPLTLSVTALAFYAAVAPVPSLTCSSPANEIELPTQRSGARRGCATTILPTSQPSNRVFPYLRC